MAEPNERLAAIMAKQEKKKQEAEQAKQEAAEKARSESEAKRSEVSKESERVGALIGETEVSASEAVTAIDGLKAYAESQGAELDPEVKADIDAEIAGETAKAAEATAKLAELRTEKAKIDAELAAFGDAEGSVEAAPAEVPVEAPVGAVAEAAPEAGAPEIPTEAAVAEVPAEAATEATVEAAAEQAEKNLEEMDEKELNEHFKEIAEEIGDLGKTIDEWAASPEKSTPEKNKEMAAALARMAEIRGETTKTGNLYVEKLLKTDAEKAYRAALRIYGAQREFFPAVKNAEAKIMAKMSETDKENFGSERSAKEKRADVGELRDMTHTELDKEEVEDLLRFDGLWAEIHQGKKDDSAALNSFLGRFNSPSDGGDQLGTIMAESGIEALTALQERVAKDPDVNRQQEEVLKLRIGGAISNRKGRKGTASA